MDFKKVVNNIVNDINYYHIKTDIKDLSSLLLSLFKYNDNIFHYLINTDLFKYLAYLLKPFISTTLFNQQLPLLFIIIIQLLNHFEYGLIDNDPNGFIWIIKETILFNFEYNHLSLIKYFKQCFKKNVNNVSIKNIIELLKNTDL